MKLALRPNCTHSSLVVYPTALAELGTSNSISQSESVARLPYPHHFISAAFQPKGDPLSAKYAS
jgi:hypothetical protein